MTALLAIIIGIPLGCVVAARSLRTARAESRCLCCGAVECDCHGCCRDCWKCDLCCRCSGVDA